MKKLSLLTILFVLNTVIASAQNSEIIDLTNKSSPFVEQLDFGKTYRIQIGRATSAYTITSFVITVVPRGYRSVVIYTEGNVNTILDIDRANSYFKEWEGFNPELTSRDPDVKIEQDISSINLNSRITVSAVPINGQIAFSITGLDSDFREALLIIKGVR